MTDVISIGPVVVWIGSPTRSQRRVRDVAKWRERHWTLGHVMKKLGLHPDPVFDTAEHCWCVVVLTRMDDGKPRARTRYHVSTTGRIERFTEDTV